MSGVARTGSSQADFLIEEIIELADNGSEDLELVKIAIAARQWLVE